MLYNTPFLIKLFAYLDNIHYFCNPKVAKTCKINSYCINNQLLIVLEKENLKVINIIN